MGLLRDRLALREIAEANRLVEAGRRIEADAYQGDCDGYQWCRYCGLAQYHETPTHSNECPVTVVTLAADKMSNQTRKEVA